MHQLQRQLATAGLDTAPVGDRVLVAGFGGRVLALAPDGHTNLFWVNPELPSQLAQWRPLRAGSGWANIGGDRAWISPEVDTNVSLPPGAPPAYLVPVELDPGNYALTPTADGVCLTNRCALRWLRTGQSVELTVARTVQPLAAPPLALPAGVAFAGYSLDSELRTDAPLGSARPAVWSIIQVPGGGTITATVTPDATPVACIGTPEWTHAPGATLLRTAAVAATSFKWSLPAGHCRGRLLYRQPLADGRAGLVVREFPVGPAADYADCPWHDFADTGQLCQVYVDDGKLGGFAELEFHAPSLMADRRPTVACRCTTWGFIGPAPAIGELERDLAA